MGKIVDSTKENAVGHSKNEAPGQALALGAPSIGSMQSRGTGAELRGVLPAFGHINPAFAQAAELRRHGAPLTKAAALARHRRNRARIKALISAGFQQTMDESLGADSRKNLWRNTAQWLAVGNAKVVVLSPVHDSELRVDVSPDQLGYFDTRVEYNSNAATYSDDVLNNAGIEIEKPKRVMGTMSSDGITMTLIDPESYGDNELIETLIHEVQHDADQSQEGGAFTVPRPAGAIANSDVYNSYQSELRAYWFENPEGSSADTWGSSADPVSQQISLKVCVPGPDGTFGNGNDIELGTVTTALKNARQENILRHLLTPDRPFGDWLINGEETQPYATVAYYLCMDPKFAQMVNAYDKPVSGNTLNSVRIQLLSDAVSLKDLELIRQACDLLDGADIDYLKDRVRSKPFWDQVAQGLSGQRYAPHTTHIRIYIDTGVLPPLIMDGGSYKVVAGDTLSRIALRALGDASRSLEIAALNSDLIKNPNVIQPGWTLRLPS